MEARNMNGASRLLDESYAERLVNKWQQLLVGVNDPWNRRCLAIMMENQSTDLRKGHLHEDTTSANAGPYTKYIFPLLRRVFPNMIASQIVSLQPMTAPVGAVFKQEYKYSDTKGNTVASTNLIQNFQKYYSSEYVDYELRVDASDVDGTKVIWNNSTNAVERVPFKWLPLHSLNTTKGYAVKFFWTSGGVTKTQTDNGAGGFTGDGTPGGSSVNYTTGDWTINTTGSIPDNNTPIYATYWYNSELVSSTRAPAVNGSLYSNTDQVAQNPGIFSNLEMVPIEAITRKLTASWSLEGLDDFRSLHGLDAEAELVAGMANEISLELDREIITDLVSGAQFSATYNFTVGPTAVPSGVGTVSELDSIRGLVTVMESMAAKIHVATLRAPANFAVVSPQVGAMLAQLTTHGDFMNVNRIAQQTVAPSYGPMNSNFGIQMIGTLMNKYTIYQDPFLGLNGGANILMGLKGSNFLDAGYVYAPYVPLQMTATWENPNTFTSHKGMRTRYGKKMLRAEYYGRITVVGFPTISG